MLRMPLRSFIHPRYKNTISKCLLYHQEQSIIAETPCNISGRALQRMNVTRRFYKLFFLLSSQSNLLKSKRNVEIVQQLTRSDLDGQETLLISPVASVSEPEDLL